MDGDNIYGALLLMLIAMWCTYMGAFIPILLWRWLTRSELSERVATMVHQQMWSSHPVIQNSSIYFGFQFGCTSMFESAQFPLPHCSLLVQLALSSPGNCAACPSNKPSPAWNGRYHITTWPFFCWSWSAAWTYMPWVSNQPSHWLVAGLGTCMDVQSN